MVRERRRGLAVLILSLPERFGTANIIGGYFIKMENVKNIFLAFISVFATVFIAVLLALWIFPKNQQLGGGEMFPITRMATSGVIAITPASKTTNELLVGSSTARSYLAITNDCTSPVYLSFNDESVFDNNNLSAGLRLNANGGSFEVNQQNRYTGAIRASSTVNCEVSVAEAQ